MLHVNTYMNRPLRGLVVWGGGGGGGGSVAEERGLFPHALFVVSTTC